MNSMNQQDVAVVDSGTETRPFGRSVTWGLSLVLVVLGSVFAFGGSLLSGFADRARITEWVASGRITSTDMTDAELIDSVLALVWGGGVAVAITGGLLIVAGVAFLVVGTRERRRFRTTGVAHRSTLGNAIVGAVVTLAVWLVPLAPLLGGGVAGYLHRDSETSALRTATIAGVFATFPLIVLFAATIWSLLGSASGVTSLIIFALVVSMVVSVAYTIGLSAVGGQLGLSFGTDRTATN